MTEKYDVIIIGAGIGGLTCGCYLAQEGLNVLIVEQHDKVGGYCGSFERNGYSFDIGVHYLGGVKKWELSKILEDLELKDRIKFNQLDPTDKIIMPDNITYFRANPEDTVNEFKKSFPKQKANIDAFFKFILQSSYFNIYKKARSISFQEFLDEYFVDYKIKGTLEALISNIGISAKKVPALVAIFLYRQYLLDAGHYPRGGMQVFCDTFANRFTELKGRLILCRKVNKILLKNSIACGVELDDGEIFNAKYIVSNADATHTFSELLGGECAKESAAVNRMQVSQSLFALYLGLDNQVLPHLKETTNVWKFSNYELDSYFSNIGKSIKSPNLPALLITFPSFHSNVPKSICYPTIQCFLYAPFGSKQFWVNFKNELSSNIIKEVEKIFPGLSKYIKVKVIGTPHTFYRYTLNREGAAYGWLSSKGQLDSFVFPQKTSIQNLFLAGHWCTMGTGQGGVPKSMNSGKCAASKVLFGMNKKWRYNAL
jgi:phytoene dehydrogenase-like protein